MAVGDRVVEPLGEGKDAALSAPSPAAGASGAVCAEVTYSLADARAAVLTTLPRRTPLLYGTSLVLLALLVILYLATGDPLPGAVWATLGVLAFSSVLYLVVMPWQIVKARQPAQSWVISAQGVRITLPGTDVSHDWSRFDEIVVRPMLVQFRIGRCNLSLPRRCLAETDLPTIEALAAGGNVTMRPGGRFR